MRDIQDIARFVGLSLLSKQMTVSPLKLQKILYYIQAWYMVFFGRENTLFAEKPQAWVNGPVYPSIYRTYRDAVPNMCDHLRLSDFDNTTDDATDAFRKEAEVVGFNAEEEELIESIITLYGAKTQNELIFLTHAEKPWVEGRGDKKPYEKSIKELSLDTMYEYYKSRHEKNKAQA